MDYIKAAFDQVCAKAQPAQSNYVSLYVELPYYGGPEEGGWWGSDTKLVAYQECVSDVEAQQLQEQVKELAAQLNKQAKNRFNAQCANEIEWLEQRDPMAEESDYFPEPDGEEHYWVAVETKPGSFVSQGSRYYE